MLMFMLVIVAYLLLILAFYLILRANSRERKMLDIVTKMNDVSIKMNAVLNSAQLKMLEHEADIKKLKQRLDSDKAAKFGHDTE